MMILWNQSIVSSSTRSFVTNMLFLRVGLHSEGVRYVVDFSTETPRFEVLKAFFRVLSMCDPT